MQGHPADEQLLVGECRSSWQVHPRESGTRSDSTVHIDASTAVEPEAAVAEFRRRSTVVSFPLVFISVVSAEGHPVEWLQVVHRVTTRRWNAKTVASIATKAACIEDRQSMWVILTCKLTAYITARWAPVSECHYVVVKFVVSWFGLPHFTSVSER